MKSKIKRLLAVLLASTLASSCAAQPPQIAHMEATQFEQEHDEMIYPHAIVDIYPSRNAPHEVIVHKDSGGTADLICLNHNCTESTGQIKGSKSLPDGSYQFVQTDDPKIAVVRDVEGTRLIGYTVSDGSVDSKFFETLDKAHSYEHKGDNVKLAGKIILVTRCRCVSRIGCKYEYRNDKLLQLWKFDHLYDPLKWNRANSELKLIPAAAFRFPTLRPCPGDAAGPYVQNGSIR